MLVRSTATHIEAMAIVPQNSGITSRRGWLLWLVPLIWTGASGGWVMVVVMGLSSDKTSREGSSLQALVGTPHRPVLVVPAPRAIDPRRPSGTWGTTLRPGRDPIPRAARRPAGSWSSALPR